MQSFLRSRPAHFKSIQNAIEWCVRSGQIRNIESAKVSMPGQIVNNETNKLAASELPLTEESDSTPANLNPMSIPENEEEEEEQGNKFQAPLPTSNPKKYSWRIDLSRTEKYWKGWFEDLSNKFLHYPLLH